jgi:hypothetical protein
MDMNNESNEKGSESNRASSGGAGIPVEWQNQFRAAFPTQQQAPMIDSFASAGQWASTSQAMGLSDVSAMSAARGGGFLAPVPGFLPQGLGHFPVDSGFIERAARASCFGGGGGVMGAKAGFGAADQSMTNAFSGPSEALLDHQRKDGNDKAEPELSRNGHDEVPSLEAAGGDCSSKGISDSKKGRRPNEVSAFLIHV